MIFGSCQENLSISNMFVHNEHIPNLITTTIPSFDTNPHRENLMPFTIYERYAISFERSQNLSFLVILLLLLLSVFTSTTNYFKSILIIISIISCNIYHVDGTWNLVTSPPLPNEDFWRMPAYDPEANIVWLLGGWLDQERMIPFNPAKSTCTDYGSILSDNIYTRGQGYVQKGNILYMADYNGLYYFDLSSPMNVQPLGAWPTNFELSGISGGCLANIDNYLIMTRRGDVYIYDIGINNWSIIPPNTPTMVQSRSLVACQVSSDKYLYVIGGNDEIGSV